MAMFSFKSRRNAGMNRSTLRAMLQMDAARLNDMGLTRYDVAEALRKSGSAAGQILDARRNERAREWLR